MAKITTSNKSVKTKKTTSKVLSVNSTSSKVDTTKLKARKDYYASSDVMQMNSTVYNGKNSNVPYLNKKQTWLYTRLASNDIEKNWNYTLDSLSNDYRKTIKDSKESTAKAKNYKFRQSFKSNEIFSIGDLKAVIHYFYHVNSRLFEFYRNDKKNYLIHEVEFKSNLSTAKNRK